MMGTVCRYAHRVSRENASCPKLAVELNCGWGFGSPQTS
jgi:hypothetical protein